MQLCPAALSQVLMCCPAVVECCHSLWRLAGKCSAITSLVQTLVTGAEPAQIGAFLVLLRAKGETAEEIAGMARAMRALSVPVETPYDGLYSLIPAAAHLVLPVSAAGAACTESEPEAKDPAAFILQGICLACAADQPPAMSLRRCKHCRLKTRPFSAPSHSAGHCGNWWRWHWLCQHLDRCYRHCGCRWRQGCQARQPVR